MAASLTLSSPRVAPRSVIRVTAISAMTSSTVVAADGVELPSLYFSHKREVVERQGMLVATGPWTPPGPDEDPFIETVRYRTVGDMTCTGAVRSEAANPDEIVVETAASRVTERGATRADDRFSETAMEDRKREGYF